MDPFRFLVDVAGPLAATCSAVQIVRCRRDRRGATWAVAGLLAFAVATIGLGVEAQFLARQGLPMGRIWWLPWR